MRRRKKGRVAGLCILLIVILLALVMSVQIFGLYQKNQQYIAREEALKERLAEEENRRQELEAYEDYLDTQEYIESTAQSKLGLVYEGQIVFKEQK